MFPRESEYYRQYERDGYALVDLFTAAEVERLLELWRRESPGLEGLPFVATIMSPDRRHRCAVDAALREICAPALERVWPGAQLVLCQINDKRPAGEESVVGLHQDWSLTDEGRFRAVGLFCPLVDTDATNGALFAVPGTHRLPCIARSMYDVQPYPEFERAFLAHAKLLPMAAGQACAHELMLYHGSVPNHSARCRPAVGLLLVERDAPLRHYVRDADAIVEYEMQPEQFLGLRYGADPETGRKLSRVTREVPALTEQDIEAVVATRFATSTSVTLE